MIIQNVKGGYDFLPKEQKVRNFINDTLRETFEEYGYNPIETPILCYYDMLSDKYDEGNDILKEIYKLTDQGGRSLGLRYDLTVPFAKFIALNKNKITLPFKRYEINKVFRDGPVKLGRDREFTQCDVDVVGLSGQMIEAELMNLYVDGFKKLGIDIILKYNSRKLMSGIIKECGVADDLLAPVTTVIDKLNKISSQEFATDLICLGLEQKDIDFIERCFKMDLNDLKIKFENTENTLIKEGLEELETLTDYITKLGIVDVCLFSPTLARGQNYYTGNVFEVYDKEKRLDGSIGGGGRYDNMVTEFIDDGNVYPAVGISFGLSSIYEILKDDPKFASRSLTDIYIIPIDTTVDSLKLARNLRELGYKVEIEMQGKKVGKSLDFANRNKIPYVIILGSSEVEAGKFKLKNMFENTETEVDISNLKCINEIIKK